MTAPGRAAGGNAGMRAASSWPPWIALRTRTSAAGFADVRKPGRQLRESPVSLRATSVRGAPLNSCTPCANSNASTTNIDHTMGIASVRPLHPLPTPITDLEQITRFHVRRHDRLGGILREYKHAA
jgi:hypothetical protein